MTPEALTPQAGDVILVAYMAKGRWISRRIQKISGSWYSHAMIALGDGRFAHAKPARGGNVVIVESDADLGALIHDRTVYDLYRSEQPPDVDRLHAVVADYLARSREAPAPHEYPCGRISKIPGVLFSDGNLLALAALRGCQLSKPLLRTAPGRRLHDAIVVTAEDDEGRLLCSGFVHRVLDAAGARPQAAPPDKSFIDLSDFPTDEPELKRLGRPFLVDWLLQKLTGGLDIDEQSLQTCLDVIHIILCHWERRTPVPAPLHVANFVTPADLALSPSLRRKASRYRLPTGDDSGWTAPLRMPLFEDGLFTHG